MPIFDDFSRISELKIGESNLLMILSPYIGAKIEDTSNPHRYWTVTNIFAPNERLAIRGVRLRLRDQTGVTTFLNQRDAEVLLDIAEPGWRVPWQNNLIYPRISDSSFVGFAMDVTDLADDLHILEANLRKSVHATTGRTYLSDGRIERKVYTGSKNNSREVFEFVSDTNSNGLMPDLSLTSIGSRWRRVTQEYFSWQRPGLPASAATGRYSLALPLFFSSPSGCWIWRRTRATSSCSMSARKTARSTPGPLSFATTAST